MNGYRVSQDNNDEKNENEVIITGRIVNYKDLEPEPWHREFVLKTIKPNENQ